MITRASGHSALLLAAGVWICCIYFAGPSQAAPATDDAAATPASASAAPIAPSKSAKHSSHHAQTSAHRKSGDESQKSADGKKAGAAEAAADNGAPSMPQSSAIPPSVANANAQLPATDTLAGNNARAMSQRANSIVQAAPDASPTADMQIVSADQLNDVDRALHETPSPATPLATASADNVPVMAASSPLMATGSGNTTWDRTSLIGKIFIGFGVLLTMASAVRMFIA